LPTKDDTFVSDIEAFAKSRGWNTTSDLAPCGCITVGMYKGDDVEADGAIQSVAILLCQDDEA
jgi:hypothetical protein